MQRIPGGIVGDDSRYDAVRYLPQWKSTYRTDGEIGPLGALTVNDGFSAWSPSRKVPVDDPAVERGDASSPSCCASAGSTVGSIRHRHRARGRGRDRAGDVADRCRPSSRRCCRRATTSPPSCSTKEIGVKAANAGTTAAGVAATTAKLQELGVPIADGALVDGSGLDRGNRVTCANLVATLGLAARPELTTLYDGLPVAGQSGTLVDQFVGTDARRATSAARPARSTA